MLKGNPANNTGNLETSLFTDCLEYMFGDKQERSELYTASRSLYLREIH